MADDTPIDGEDTSEDSTFDNLPPLSDFESADGGDSGFDSNLPPLNGPDSDSEDTPSDTSEGLPPISDIPIETPVPTGGAVKPAPVGFEEGTGLDTPISDGPDTPLNTPVEDESSAFQDLAADSDFTPETPEVAPPGPDSDMETPMFDSAFGGDSAEFSGAVDTSAPTQAMATPMFGSEAGAPPDVPAFAEAPPSDSPEFAGADDDFSFDDDATFGGAEPGTPAPDFADTPSPVEVAPVAAPEAGPPGGAGPPPAPAGPQSRLKGLLVPIIVGLVCLAVGLFAGGIVLYKVPAIPAPKPWVADIDEAKSQLATEKSSSSQLKKDIKVRDDQIADLEKQIQNLQPTGVAPLTQEQVAKLREDYDKYSADLAKVEADLKEKTDAYALLTDDHEALQNDVAIARSWERGLQAEVNRLQTMVGTLEDFNARRIVSKETLESDVAQLAIQVREGNALVPEAYSRSARVAAVDRLLDRVTDAKWVSPELLDEYTDIYLTELNIANVREYFFAKIPVQDRFGTESMSWAECLMNGNWSTYFRTVDGKHVGAYQPAKDLQPPQFEFVETELSEGVKLQIEGEIVNARTPGDEKRIDILLQKQAMFDDKSNMQTVMDSL